MARLVRGALVVAAVVTGARLVRKKLQQGHEHDRRDQRWCVVTVNLPLADVEGDPRLRETFARFGPDLENRISAAPGGRGTEIAARLRAAEPIGLVDRVTGEDPRQELRKALREVKSLLETGEVLRPDEPTAEPHTPGAHLVDLASKRAGGEGVL